MTEVYVAKQPHSEIQTRWWSDFAMPACLLFMATLWMRWPSFKHSVIDHDESTYIIIGEALWNGKLLYTDVWDTKPAGIFLLFGFVLKVFNGSIFTIRMLATLAISFTAFYLYRAKRNWNYSHVASLTSGVTCVVMCSAHQFGLPAHIELFFMPCVAMALWLLSARDTLINATVAGLVLGLGFIIKYVALFDIIPLALIFLITPLWCAWRQQSDSTINHLKKVCLFTIACILPFAFLHLAFLITGNFEDFYQATYVIPRRYVNSGTPENTWRMIKSFHHIYLQFLVPFYVSMIAMTMSILRHRMRETPSPTTRTAKSETSVLLLLFTPFGARRS